MSKKEKKRQSNKKSKKTFDIDPVFFDRNEINLILSLIIHIGQPIYPDDYDTNSNSLPVYEEPYPSPNMAMVNFNMIPNNIIFNTPMFQYNSLFNKNKFMTDLALSKSFRTLCSISTNNRDVQRKSKIMEILMEVVVERAARFYRNSIAYSSPKLIWSGVLPFRKNKSKRPAYSRKLFIGGIPWNTTEVMLMEAFLKYGLIDIQWPKNNTDGTRKGFVYIVLMSEYYVWRLLKACLNNLVKIPMKRRVAKRIEVIPWKLSDVYFRITGPIQRKKCFTVFIGALHGKITAEGLALLMNDLFSGVVYVKLDVDRYKYPTGSAQVVFNNRTSYMQAIETEFVYINTSYVKKAIQIEPFLRNTKCSVCGLRWAPFFCRHNLCMEYFCRICWVENHLTDLSLSHRPLLKNSKRNSLFLLTKL